MVSFSSRSYLVRSASVESFRRDVKIALGTGLKIRTFKSNGYCLYTHHCCVAGVFFFIIANVFVNLLATKETLRSRGY